MTIARFLLIFVLTVGIIIRSCTNCIYIDNLIKKIRLIVLIRKTNSKTVKDSSGSLDVSPQSDFCESKEAIMKAEMSDMKRILYRMIMGIIPAF